LAAPVPCNGVAVGTPVDVDGTKELAESSRRLARRVNALESSQVSVGCAKAVVGVAALFLFTVAVLVAATLSLAYAEHRWDVPVFTRLVKGR
jgi:hypothetical protein